MTRTGPAGALLALLAVTACNGDGSPSASESPTTTPSSVPTTSLATSTPATTPTSTWPAGCPSPTALPAGATVITATVEDGKVSPPRKTYDVKLKSIVRLLVTADTVDEVHLHTYDRHAPTKPGCPATIDFEAGIPATVEVEIEGTGLHLFQVRARP